MARRFGRAFGFWRYGIPEEKVTVGARLGTDGRDSARFSISALRNIDATTANGFRSTLSTIQCASSY